MPTSLRDVVEMIDHIVDGGRLMRLHHGADEVDPHHAAGFGHGLDGFVGDAARDSPGKARGSCREK